MQNATLCISLLLLLTASCSAQKETSPKIADDSLRLYLTEIMTEFNIPAVQLALVTDREILEMTALGVNKLGGEDTVSLHSKMHLGSCGKAMTGYLAGVLVAKNVLDWDTRVADLLPELLPTIHQDHRDLTLKALLSHQARIPEFVSDASWRELRRFTEADPVERRYDFAAWILRQPPLPFDSSQLQAGFRYSNAGYTLATVLLERATGRSWEQLMEKEVFTPLSIDATVGWPACKDPTQPYGHLTNMLSGQLTPHDPNDNYQIDPILAPSGDLSMSVLDYAKFIRKNLAGLNGQDKDHDRAFYEFLHYANRPAAEYGIGWYSISQFNDDLSSHAGSADTFYCLNLLFRKRKLGVIVIANAASESTQTGLKKIRNHLIRPYLSE